MHGMLLHTQGLNRDGAQRSVVLCQAMLSAAEWAVRFVRDRLCEVGHARRTPVSASKHKAYRPQRSGLHCGTYRDGKRQSARHPVSGCRQLAHRLYCSVSQHAVCYGNFPFPAPFSRAAQYKHTSRHEVVCRGLHTA